MTDAGYWGHRTPLDSSPQLPKRARNDYDCLPGASGVEGLNYLPREDERAGLQTLRDSTTIGASYDRYLQTTQNHSCGSVEAGHINGSGVMKGINGGILDDNVPLHVPFRYPIMNQVKTGILDPGTCGLKALAEGQFVSQVPKVSAILPLVPGQGLCLPPDASDSIFVEDLPLDSTEREVAHIFRPFLGYKETRLVKKEPKHPDGVQKVFSFVDFTDATSAMTALNVLQGYKLDERKPDSPVLKLKFSRAPDPKSAYGSRSKR